MMLGKKRTPIFAASTGTKAKATLSPEHIDAWLVQICDNWCAGGVAAKPAFDIHTRLAGKPAAFSIRRTPDGAIHLYRNKAGQLSPLYHSGRGVEPGMTLERLRDIVRAVFSDPQYGCTTHRRELDVRAGKLCRAVEHLRSVEETRALMQAKRRGDTLLPEDTPVGSLRIGDLWVSFRDRASSFRIRNGAGALLFSTNLGFASQMKEKEKIALIRVVNEALRAARHKEREEWKMPGNHGPLKASDSPEESSEPQREPPPGDVESVQNNEMPDCIPEGVPMPEDYLDMAKREEEEGPSWIDLSYLDGAEPASPARPRTDSLEPGGP